MNKAYIGDAIYAEVVEVVEGCDQIKIYTSDGIRIFDPIYIEPETWNALKTYVKRYTKWEPE